MTRQNVKPEIQTPFSRNNFRRMARYWLGIGLAGLALCVALIVAHYIFKIPVYEGHAQRVLKPMEFGIHMGIMAAVFSAFAVLGALILRVEKKD